MSRRTGTPRVMVARWCAVSLVAALVGCSSGSSAPDSSTSAPPRTSTATSVAVSTPPPTSAPRPTTSLATTTTLSPAPADLLARIQDDVSGSPPGCDPLDTAHCFLPYPSNAYTVADPATPTGRRVALPADGAPRNSAGVAIDVAEWNRNDGFSPSSSILAVLPGLDAAMSHLPSWSDLGASYESGVRIVDIDTGEPIPAWAEVDSSNTDPATRALIVHPAISLFEGHRFAVGLSGMVDGAGTPLPAGAVFTAYRDGLVTGIDKIEARRASMEEVFAALDAAGLERAGLVLAWDFTVASTAGLSSRMLHIRDDALAALGEATPAFAISAVVDNPEGVDGIARQVTGTFTVPNYLTGDGGPGNRFHYDTDPATDPDALPSANGTRQAPFVCNIPDSVMAGNAPAHLVEYGHGLLGSNREINARNLREFTNAYDVVVCATKWAGMSDDDIGNAVATLGDLSLFPTVIDRLQQGVLEQIFLGRVMTGADGLASDPSFQRPGGAPLVDTAHLDYDGNSQGGIMGLMLAAVSPDIERAVLGVPGMNYSLLLPRSVDFDTYEAVMIPAYPSAFDRTLIIAMMQMLWDRGEGAGYAQHVTADPYEATPAKTVLLHVAFGDWQVSELSAFVEARTLGAAIHRPVTADGRSGESEPGWGLDTIEYPWEGSGMVVWDSGSDPIPAIDEPPSTGRDPHEDPRLSPDAMRQKASFLFDDTLVDVCAASPCRAAPAD